MSMCLVCFAQLHQRLKSTLFEIFSRTFYAFTYFIYPVYPGDQNRNMIILRDE